MSSGKLVLFSGPSGVGKDTLLEVLTKKRPELQRSISLTTRQRRNGEKDGVDYFFVTPAHFQELLAAGDVLEFAQYGKNLYGTPKKPVDEWLHEGKTVILISHRLASVKMSDFIFVIADGTLAEAGSHAELMKKNGLYRSMYEEQAKWYEEDGNPEAEKKGGEAAYES